MTKRGIRVRMMHHNYAGLSGRTHGMAIAAAFRKHGKGAFTCDVISNHRSGDAAGNAEKAAIVKFGTLSPNGYNVATGGHNHRHVPREWTPKQRRHHSRSQRGRVLSLEARKAMSDAARKKRLSKAHRKKIGDASRGKPNHGVALAGLLRAKKGNTTKTPGGRWMARIKTAGITAYIGTYDTRRESIAAYNAEREKRIAILRRLIARRALTTQQRRNRRIAIDREKWLAAHQ